MPAETTDVAIVLYDGFDELDAVGPFEVFRTANALGGPIDAALVTLENETSVTASHGLVVEPDDVLHADADDALHTDADDALHTDADDALHTDADDALHTDADVVLVPGGGWNDRSDAGAWAEVQSGALPDRLATLHENGVRLASVCTGALLLAEAGLLDGRPATTHHSARDDLADYGVDVREDRVVDEDDVVTAGGITSGIDLALHLVDDYCDGDVADAVAGELEWESRR